MISLFFIFLILPNLALCQMDTTVDLCSPCQRHHHSQCARNMNRFTRTLSHRKQELSEKLLYITSRADYNWIWLDESQDWTLPSLFPTDNDLVDDLFVSYQSITELVANLTLFSHIQTSHTIAYDTTPFLTPVCYLWRTLNNLGYDPPCAVCRKNIEDARPPLGSYQEAMNFVDSTLRRGEALINQIRHRFSQHP